MRGVGVGVLGSLSGPRSWPPRLLKLTMGVLKAAEGTSPAEYAATGDARREWIFEHFLLASKEGHSVELNEGAMGPSSWR